MKMKNTQLWVMNSEKITTGRKYYQCGVERCFNSCINDERVKVIFREMGGVTQVKENMSFVL